MNYTVESKSSLSQWFLFILHYSGKITSFLWLSQYLCEIQIFRRVELYLSFVVWCHRSSCLILKWYHSFGQLRSLKGCSPRFSILFFFFFSVYVSLLSFYVFFFSVGKLRRKSKLERKIIKRNLRRLNLTRMIWRRFFSLKEIHSWCSSKQHRYKTPINSSYRRRLWHMLRYQVINPFFCQCVCVCRGGIC